MMCVPTVGSGLMGTGRSQAVDREAKRLRDELIQGRKASLTTTDTNFRADVLARLRQILAGEEQRWEDADD